MVTGWLPQKAAQQISEYLKQDLNQLDKIDRSALYKGKPDDIFGHSEDHIERVVVLGTALAAKAELPQDIFKLLLICLKYHDIGKTHDSLELQHGQWSSEKLKKLFAQNPEMFDGINTQEDLGIVCEAIRLHSIDDKYLVEVKKNKKLHTVASYLKDADNLDRVRFNGLDPRYLRSPHAKNMVSFAQSLFDRSVEQKNKSIATGLSL